MCVIFLDNNPSCVWFNSLQTTGECECQVNVTGMKCDRCIDGRYGISEPIKACVGMLNLKYLTRYLIF